MITITGNNVFDWILTVFIWIYVVSIIERVLDIGKAKAENLRLEYINTQSKKIDNTSQFFILVDYIIRHEIDKILQSYSLLHKAYEIINLDQDFATIANNTYLAVEKEILTNNSIIFTNTYIMTYISSRSRLLFFQSAIEFNNNIRQISNPPTA